MKKEIIFGVCLGLLILLIPIFVFASDNGLVADFRFENSLIDSISGNTKLVTLDETTFQTSTVDGLNKTVLSFPAGGGVALESASNVFSSEAYSIVMLFQFENTGSWRRMIDFKNRTSDNGLYAYGANLQFYNVSTGTGGSILPETYLQVALTRDLSKNVNGYVNGNPEINFVDNSDSAVVDSSDILSFFRDDLRVKNEHSAGSVARIRIYNRALTRQEINLLDRLSGQSGEKPNIISELHVTTIKDEPFTYSIEATNNPIAFSATNLPQWASLDNETGIITATPSQIGTSEIYISATNSAGTESAKLILTVISLEEQSIGFSLPSYSFFENSISPSVMIVRTGNIDSEIEVECTTTNGTASSASDYEDINRTIEFKSGETYKIIPLTIIGDNEIESTENFSIRLENVSAGVKIIEPNPVNIDILDGCTTVVGDCSQSDLDSAKENGRQECIDDPESCGISVDSDNYQEGYDQGYSDGQAMCEDETECTQVITYAQVPDADCWVMFSTPCDVPEGWDTAYEEPEDMCVKSSENTSTPTTGDSCATLEGNLDINIPCIDVFGNELPIYLEKYVNPEDPFGYYWMLNLE